MTAAIPFALLAALAGLRIGEGESTSYKLGAILGAAVIALIVALVVRFLWVKTVRRGRRPVRSPWLLVVAANVALLTIFADVGQEVARCEEAPGVQSILARAPEQGRPAPEELMRELRRNIPGNAENELRALAARTYGPADDPDAIVIIFLANEELDPEETSRGFGAGAKATPREIELGTEEGFIIDVPDGVAVLGLPHACAAATVISADESSAVRLATELVNG